MADFKITVNVDEIAQQLNKKKEEILSQTKKAVKGLAIASHAHVLELAGDKLKSLQSKYKDAVDFEQVDDNLFVVSLSKEAMWIEKGHGAWSMYDKLSSSPKAKTSKEGHKYLTIPFEHSKKPSEQSAKAREITDQVKSFLKKEKIPYKKIEYNPDGSPKMGLIHKFDIKSAKPSEKAKFPTLQGVAIYQRKDKETGKIKKDIMTFRVVSEKNKGDGRWEYQPREGVNIFEETYKWAINTWNQQILPALIDSLK
jgi:hypothetical protein